MRTVCSRWSKSKAGRVDLTWSPILKYRESYVNGTTYTIGPSIIFRILYLRTCYWLLVALSIASDYLIMTLHVLAYSNNKQHNDSKARIFHPYRPFLFFYWCFFMLLARFTLANCFMSFSNFFLRCLFPSPLPVVVISFESMPTYSIHLVMPRRERSVLTFDLRIIHEEVCLHGFLLVETTLTWAAEQSNKGSYFVLSGEHILLAMLVCGEVLLWLCVQLCDLGLLGSGRFRGIWGFRFFRCFIFARADFGARRELWFVLLDPIVLVSMPLLYLNDRMIIII